MSSSVLATMGLAGSIAPVSLSSSASFGSPLVNAAPLRPVARRNVVVARAALPESGRSARREILASLVAAGAALTVAGQSFAASGPGTPGAQRTNEKANDLLKAADKLTTEDSPPRFGPGRTGGGDESDRIAQKGGAGAVQDLQGGANDAIEGAKSNLAKAKTRIDGIFGKKTGDISDASTALNDAAGKVSSDIDTTNSKVSSDISKTKEKAGSFVGDAQSKIDDSSKDGKSLIGGIVDKIQGSIPQ